MNEIAQIASLIGAGGGTVAAGIGWCIWQMAQMKAALASLAADVEWIKQHLDMAPVHRFRGSHAD